MEEIYNPFGNLNVEEEKNNDSVSQTTELSNTPLFGNLNSANPFGGDFTTPVEEIKTESPKETEPNNVFDFASFTSNTTDEELTKPIESKNSDPIPTNNIMDFASFTSSLKDETAKNESDVKNTIHFEPIQNDQHYSFSEIPQTEVIENHSIDLKELLTESKKLEETLNAHKKDLEETEKEVSLVKSENKEIEEKVRELYVQKTIRDIETKKEEQRIIDEALAENRRELEKAKATREKLQEALAKISPKEESYQYHKAA